MTPITQIFDKLLADLERELPPVTRRSPIAAKLAECNRRVAAAELAMKGKLA